jgi:hypothetical protein
MFIFANSRVKTAVLEDFSEPDETFLNAMDVNVEDDLFRYYYDYQILLDNNISVKRYTIIFINRYSTNSSFLQLSQLTG